MWINRVLLPAKEANSNFTELNDLNEAHTMLAETVKQWFKDAKQAGREEGREEGLEKGRQAEAAKLFMLLLESKFGSINQQIQHKVSTANPELIEAWTKQIFEASTPEDLLDS